MAKKERQRHYIEKGMNIPLDESKKKGKKRVRKPKMPARIKKDKIYKRKN